MDERKVLYSEVQIQATIGCHLSKSVSPTVATHFMQKEIDTWILTRSPVESIVIQAPMGEQIKVTVLGL